MNDITFYIWKACPTLRPVNSEWLALNKNYNNNSLSYMLRRTRRQATSAARHFVLNLLKDSDRLILVGGSSPGEARLAVKNDTPMYSDTRSVYSGSETIPIIYCWEGLGTTNTELKSIQAQYLMAEATVPGWRRIFFDGFCRAHGRLLLEQSFWRSYHCTCLCSVNLIQESLSQFVPLRPSELRNLSALSDSPPPYSFYFESGTPTLCCPPRRHIMFSQTLICSCSLGMTPFRPPYVVQDPVSLLPPAARVFSAPACQSPDDAARLVGPSQRLPRKHIALSSGKQRRQRLATISSFRGQGSAPTGSGWRPSFPRSICPRPPVRIVGCQESVHVARRQYSFAGFGSRFWGSWSPWRTKKNQDHSKSCLSRLAERPNADGTGFIRQLLFKYITSRSSPSHLRRFLSPPESQTGIASSRRRRRGDRPRRERLQRHTLPAYEAYFCTSFLSGVPGTHIQWWIYELPHCSSSLAALPRQYGRYRKRGRAAWRNDYLSGCYFLESKSADKEGFTRTPFRRPSRSFPQFDVGNEA
eukprot:284818255_4